MPTTLVVPLLLLFNVPLPTKPAHVIAEVKIGARGPYRFLVDTGSDTTLLDPALAAELGLKPQFRTELVSPLGSSFVPGAKLGSLRIGAQALPEIEAVFQKLPGAGSGIRGLLGLNALRHSDFLLRPAAGRLELGGARPAGQVVPFQLEEGRMVVRARMGSEELTLVVDSGASHIVLFRTPAAMKNIPPIASSFTTIEGARSVVPTTWTVEMLLGSGIKLGSLPAAIVPRRGSEIAGLLPASLFKAIFVDQARQELVLSQ